MREAFNLGEALVTAPDDALGQVRVAHEMFDPGPKPTAHLAVEIVVGHALLEVSLVRREVNACCPRFAPVLSSLVVGVIEVFGHACSILFVRERARAEQTFREDGLSNAAVDDFNLIPGEAHTHELDEDVVDCRF